MITLDFSKKRVRWNGRALSKYDLAYCFDMLYPTLRWTIIYDVYSYCDLARKFKIYVLSHREKCENRLGDCLSIEI